MFSVGAQPSLFQYADAVFFEVNDVLGSLVQLWNVNKTGARMGTLSHPI